MEDVLDLYAEPYNPKRPQVCFDEVSKQLIAETRTALPARPGQCQRYDFEYMTLSISAMAPATCFCFVSRRRDGGMSKSPRNAP